jgi:hypothetical protein
MMFSKKWLLFLISVFALAHNILAQLKVTMPADRMVYQRNKLNKATIYIGGTFTTKVDQIEARLTILDQTGKPKQPLEVTSWQTISEMPANGTFLGTMPGINGGWYLLEVRALKNGTTLGTIHSQKVGVGEVFVIAGQSNAQGEITYKDTTLYNATDDRVISFNKMEDAQNNNYTPQYPSFSLLASANKIAPLGKSSWCWSTLGDLLAKNWDVPVCFYNTAYGNTSVFNWRSSVVNGVDEGLQNRPLNTLTDNERNVLKGIPYQFLKNTLQYYSSLTGVRAVLWCQGENDLGAFEGNSLDPSIYTSNMRTLINAARGHSAKNLSWVIAQTSRVGNAVSWRILDGQRQTATIPGYNTFLGPNTDNIQPDGNLRDQGGVHIYGNGLKELGQAWFTALNTTSFINNSVPHEGQAPQLPVANSSCKEGNVVEFKQAAGYGTYSWYNSKNERQAQTQNFALNQGDTYIAIARDSDDKNYVYAPPISLNSEAINIEKDKSEDLCEGQVLTIFTKNLFEKYNWSTGDTTTSIALKQTGSYTINLTVGDIYGCKYNTSKEFKLTLNPLPKTPIISSVGSANICEGQVLTILANNAEAGTTYQWSTGATSDFVGINDTKDISLKLVSAKKCESKVSNTIQVKKYPNPAKPDIIASGATTFCEGQNVNMALSESANYEWELDKKVQSGFTTQFIKASLPGNWRGRVITNVGCYSPYSEAIEIKNWKLPQEPTVTALGKTSFCNGNNVSLEATELKGALRWYQYGKAGVVSTSPTINLGTTANSQSNSSLGYYATVTSGEGCESIWSKTITVNQRANPNIPKISRVGAFMLEAKTSIVGIEGTEYTWLKEDMAIQAKTKTIKVIQAGSYSTVAKIVYNLPNESPLTCVSASSEKYFFETPKGGIFSIYSNPSNTGLVFCEAKENFDNVSVVIYDALGKKVYGQNISNWADRKPLDLRQLSNAVYKVQFSYGATREVKTLVIDKN